MGRGKYGRHVAEVVERYAKRERAEDDLARLLSACKQWKNATESRLRMLDSRGEAAKSMLKADADLIAVINELSEPPKPGASGV